MSDDHDKLIEVLMEAQITGSDEGYMTVRELAQHTGKGINTIRTRLWILKEHGEIETQLVKRINIAGITQWVPGYKYKPGE